MSAVGQQCLSFGPFAFDLHRRELRKHEVRIRLQHQPMELLQALLESPGEVVTREELRRRLWPEGLNVDFERNLNRCVNKLREALCDDAGSPRYVQTIPGRGYCFVAPVNKDILVHSAVRYAAKALPSRTLDHPVGTGALAVDSPFYIERDSDARVHRVADEPNFVLLKGPRQTGKTSLLARVVQTARRSGTRVILTDMQKFDSVQLTSIDLFLPALAEVIAEELCLERGPAESWSVRRGASANFDRFLRGEVLGGAKRMLWAIDEADRLFTYPYATDFFGLLRAWHNERALDETGVWHRLTVVITYATEAHLFITDMNQSPFNVGRKFLLTDFTLAEVAELNRRYDSPLNETEVGSLYELVAGHPYLTQSAFSEIVGRNCCYGEFAAAAANEDGPFAEHLRRVLVGVERSPEHLDATRSLLKGKGPMSTDCFYRLRSSGVIRGERARDAVPRCRLYRDYLVRHLL
jgi:DNA-binding winged helix-turn-helix (wHTH) protein